MDSNNSDSNIGFEKYAIIFFKNFHTFSLWKIISGINCVLYYLPYKYCEFGLFFQIIEEFLLRMELELILDSCLL